MTTRTHFDIVIVGAGAGGISVAASLLKRKTGLSIALVDKSEKHYYQPGWTMVGGGIFDAAQTERTTASLIPDGANWIKAAVTEFEPDNNIVRLDDNSQLTYERLIVAPGLKLNWEGVEGLTDTLGLNGVTSNYRYDLAPYTWKLVQGLKSGRALFTQPPMPIKCAG
ncbi:MAG TPA: NAD(FAD)-dependent dehydrogenase, partial [Pseudohongiella sp.]|nr:NAD(FAD)-dependent dehydrogenase [Pseudohongiella sp.]